MIKYICPKCSTSVYKVITYKDEPCEICGAKLVEKKEEEKKPKFNEVAPFPVFSKGVY